MSVPTKEQITERFKKKIEKDVTGLWYEFNGKLLVPYLSFEYLRNDFVKADVTDKKIREFMEDVDKGEILKEAKDYLSFAWDKCNNERGISANRSIDHYIEWFWLAGEYDFSAKISSEFENNYHSYGRKILEMIEIKLEELLENG